MRMEEIPLIQNICSFLILSFVGCRAGDGGQFLWTALLLASSITEEHIDEKYGARYPCYVPASKLSLRS